MATKTFKIGEYCKGGIITVETKGDKVAIIGKDWDYSQGTRRSSNQKNAKEFTRFELDYSDRRFEWGAVQFLLNLTTSYYTDKVMDWINEKMRK
jgi:outer membrane receptor protein involved in Fe transport